MEKRTVHLNIPLAEEEVRTLRLDDIVYLNGPVVNLFYAEHYQVIMDKLKAGETLPMELTGAVIYHTGAIYVKKEDGTYDVRAVGSTTSSKFNDLTPEFIRLCGIRAVIGKGGMDQATLDVMRECGCVYLAAAGGCSSVYAPKVRMTGEYWPELTPDYNQRLKLELDGFGPLFVSMDAHGNSLYEQCAREVDGNTKEIYHRLGIGPP